MKDKRLENEEIGLPINKRQTHQYIIGKPGKGWGCVRLSPETMAGLVNGGVKFVKDGHEFILTKEELINEFKVGLKKGYFKIEDLLN